MNKICCVTGSAGFIGSNLVTGCLSKGWSVTGIDNFATGYPEMVEAERYNHLPGDYAFVEADINNTEHLTTLFQGVDVVFHLAALPRISFSIDYPIEANETNIGGTLSVLEAARQAGVKRVVFSGSSSVYGGVSEFPTPETALPSPKSPYALHKQVGMEYCRLYSELHGLDTVSLLYFNVYGEHQRTGGAYSTVIPAFFEAGINGEECRIDGAGEQSRDFCHVDNVVEANILAAISSKTFVGDRFNIACGEHHTVNEVYAMVSDLLKVSLKKRHVKSRLGDPMKSHADISKAKEILNYNPKISFKDGMIETANWWKEGCPI